MTPARLAVLKRAADNSHMPGTAIIFEANNGYMLQVRYLLGHKFVKFSADKTRIVATAEGLAELELWELRYKRREAVAALSRAYQAGTFNDMSATDARQIGGAGNSKGRK